MDIIELLKSAFLGIVEGITEWLPISSTGHLILVDEFVKLNVTEEFWNMFQVVIQLGAILAVCVLFFHELNPFSPSKGAEGRRSTWTLWGKVVVACIPGAVVTILFDDYVEAHFHTPIVIALALIVYGIAFIIIERWNKSRTPKTGTLAEITYQTAFLIGLFQVLSIIPGTSRSGATIIGGLLIGVSRVAVAEFTFYLAIPVMAGASLLKVVKFALDGQTMTSNETAILVAGCISAFAVSMAAIRFLMGYVKSHDFKFFGVYRIALGAVVLTVAAVTAFG